MNVIGIGAMNMDHLYSVRNLVLDSEDIVDEFGRYPGGSAANTIYALGKLGLKTSFVGVVGADEDGRNLITDLNNVGVDTSHIRIATDTFTGTVLGLSDRLARRSLYAAPGANNLLNESDLSLDYLNSARIVHISSFVHENQFTLLVDMVRNLSFDVKLSFSPGSLYASKGLKALGPILDRTHVLFINRTELERMTSTSYTKAAWDCIKRGCETVVVTLGQGLPVSNTQTIASYIRDKNREYQVDAVRMAWQSTTETTGAGDAFAAGFLFALLKDKPLVECAVIGDIVARFSIARRGARAGLPTPEELSRQYLECTGKLL
ncbi:MAG: PfkB family carbohydrate kinase [Chloroflexota bacterium]